MYGNNKNEKEINESTLLQIFYIEWKMLICGKLINERYI